ncbi:ChaN family lipoprotein [Corticibacter populi]|nr:ChaN family lipoprotein [Corticibacter populi]
MLVLSACSTLPEGDAPASANTAVFGQTDTDWRPHAEAMAKASVLLLGEQHDAPEHAIAQLEIVDHLLEQQRLAALVLEMAERGGSTAGLARNASETQVQQALRWSSGAWPWERYRPVIMAAVSHGVSVLGGNLPRAAMQDAMQNPHWDTLLPAAEWKYQLQAIEAGHCHMLPAETVPGMARIQLARDASMAATLEQAMQPAHGTAVLIAGNGHVIRNAGVPAHLRLPQGDTYSVYFQVENGGGPAGAPQDEMLAELRVLTPPLPPVDHCEQFHQRRAPAQ